jgi:glutamate:GABA antiporter
MQVSGSAASVFGVVLSISISTFLLSYVIAIPAAVRLRTRFPDVPRPFRVPTGDTGFRILGGLCFAWVALGSWVAVFPGTLERLFGLDYDFQETWGVSQSAFEVFTLGTLAVLGILGAVGYLRARPVRVERPDAKVPEDISVTVAGKLAAQL